MYFESRLSGILLVLLIIVFASCKVKQGVKTQDLQNQNVENEYLNDGFVKAFIVQTDKTDEPCEFLIKLENGNLLEPLGLSADFKKNNENIWLKYIKQRRPGRCNNAQPVEIVEIKKRG
ncbi:MAG: hypothetical protein GXO79_15110 [Chlorobi bacterium]|nr:hypothetical protein [Chlorobiota bacterium]